MLLNTDAGSSLAMRLMANNVPEIEINAVMIKKATFAAGGKVNKVPALAIPFLNPSINA